MSIVLQGPGKNARLELTGEIDLYRDGMVCIADFMFLDFDSY